MNRRCYFFDGLKGKPVASTTLFSKGGDTKDKPISMFRSVVAVVPTSKAKAFCVRPVVRRFVLTALPISFRNAWVYLYASPHNVLRCGFGCYSHRSVNRLGIRQRCCVFVLFRGLEDWRGLVGHSRKDFLVFIRF